MRRLDLPPLWLLLFLLLAAVLARVEGQLLAGPWRWPAAALALIAGVALVGLAATAMRRARTAIMPRREASRLMTTGVFALSRNPIYLGFALVLLAAALALGSALALLLVPGYAALIDRRFVRGEEAALRATFGPAFDAYAARTRRWL